MHISSHIISLSTHNRISIWKNCSTSNLNQPLINNATKKVHLTSVFQQIVCFDLDNDKIDFGDAYVEFSNNRNKLDL